MSAKYFFFLCLSIFLKVLGNMVATVAIDLGLGLEAFNRTLFELLADPKAKKRSIKFVSFFGNRNECSFSEPAPSINAKILKC